MDALHIPTWLVNPAYKPSSSNWIYFGDLARRILGEQCQYACRYLDGHLHFPGYPRLGDGLLWIGDTGNYHFLQIEWTSAYEFVFRYVMWGLQEQWLTEAKAEKILTSMIEAKLEDFPEP